MIALNASGAPTFRLLQVMLREVQRVDLRLGQVVSSCDVALWLVLREPWQRFDYVLLPCPIVNNRGPDQTCCTVLLQILSIPTLGTSHSRGGWTTSVILRGTAPDT